MSDEPATGAGHVPRMRKSLQTSTPWLTGLEPRTMVLSPGSVGQVSLRATTPAVLVMSRFCGARSANCGRIGGVVHRGLAELCERAVDLGEQLEPAEGAILAQTAGALHGGGGGHPLGPLGFSERPPLRRYAAEVVAHAHLRTRARIGGDGERPADLAELASLRDVQATFT